MTTHASSVCVPGMSDIHCLPYQFVLASMLGASLDSEITPSQYKVYTITHTAFLYKRGGIGLHRNTQCTHRLHMQNETCNMIYATTQSSYSAKPSAQFWMQAHYSLSHYWPEKGKCQQQLSCTYLIQFNMIVICHCNARTLGA